MDIWTHYTGNCERQGVGPCCAEGKNKRQWNSLLGFAVLKKMEILGVSDRNHPHGLITLVVCEMCYKLHFKSFFKIEVLTFLFWAPKKSCSMIKVKNI